MSYEPESVCDASLWIENDAVVTIRQTSSEVSPYTCLSWRKRGGGSLVTMYLTLEQAQALYQVLGAHALG